MSGKKMGKRRPFSQRQVQENVPDQSGAYNLLNRFGDVVYSGMAGAGRLKERLQEHLAQGDVPGVDRFQVQPTSSADEARGVEKKQIQRHKPKYNQQDK